MTGAFRAELARARKAKLAHEQLASATMLQAGINVRDGDLVALFDRAAWGKLKPNNYRAVAERYITFVREV